MARPETFVRMILIGDPGVGKSSLLMRYNSDQFYVTGPTMGVDFVSKQLQDENIRVEIWDTAGQERFRSIVRAYYHNAHAAMLVFNVTDRQSFENISSWMTELRNGQDSAIPVETLIVGNKTDLDSTRKVSREEAEELADSLGSRYREVSARKGANVHEAFKLLINSAAVHRRGLKRHGRDSLVNIDSSEEPKGTCCGSSK